MASFDTHGGYFAPADYMRINVGGSHEENPNGGIQVGVDENGTPNVLEEGEPIYKDFVFSDNITADVKFLIEFGVPKQYAGKLYSEIVDDLFKEAEERPYDPISRNGLDAMLSRVAEAQEAQKDAENDKELMNELSSMSPEQLAELEQAIAQGEGQVLQEQVPQAEPMPTEEVPYQEEVVPEQMSMGPQEAVPVMACGGNMNKFYPGGFLTNDEIAQRAAEEQRLREEVHNWYEANRDKSFLEKAYEGIGRFLNGPETWTDKEGVEHPFVGGEGALGIIGGPGLLKLEGKLVGRVGKKSKGIAELGEKWVKNGKETAEKLDEARELGQNARVARSAAKANAQARKAEYLEKAKEVKSLEDAKNIAQGQAELEGILGEYAAERAALSKGRGTVAKGVGAAVATPFNNAYSASGNFIKNHSGAVRNGLIGAGVVGGIWGGAKLLSGTKETSQQNKAYQNSVHNSPFKAMGGNMYLGGTDELDRAGKKPNWLSIGTYSYPYPVAPTQIGYVFYPPVGSADNAGQPIQSGITRRSGDVYGINGNPFATNKEYVDQFVDLSDLMGDFEVVGHRKPKTGSASASNERSAIPGTPDTPLLLSNEDLDAIINGVDARDPKGVYVGNGMYMPNSFVDKVNGVPGTPLIKDTEINVPELSKGLLRKARRQKLAKNIDYRDLAAAVDVAGGIGAAFTPADHYDFNPIRPVLPVGNIQLQDQRYVPLDQNMVTNQMLANNAGTTRAIMNSGAGPGLGARLANADFSGALAVGNALGNAWSVNNQERNRVISANNQNDATRANFYRQLDSERTNILNNMALYNYQNALRTELLNNQADQQKADTVAGYVNSFKEYLANKGWENMNRNMANGNIALGWYLDELFNPIYKGREWSKQNHGSNGGTLLNAYKKNK